MIIGYPQPRPFALASGAVKGESARPWLQWILIKKMPTSSSFPGIADWVFDLDNTLYPASSGVFDQIDQRIAAYIAQFLDLDLEAARSLKKDYYWEYGSSMRGLMLNHSLDPIGFLDFVHDIDHSIIQPDDALNAALEALPGRKVIFTNASSRHAESVLGRLGITEHFSAIHDIIATNYTPKPRKPAYDSLIKVQDLVPCRAAFFEDTAHNLVPAAALGMTTIWVAKDQHQQPPQGTQAHLDHVAVDLTAFLEGVVLTALDNTDTPSKTTAR